MGAGKTGNLIFNRLIQSCGIYLIAILLAVPVMICMCSGLFLMTSSSDDQGLFFGIIMIMVGVPIYLGFIGVLAIGWVIYRNRKIDANFTALGLEAKSFALTFRQYHGTFNGRTVSGRFYRGPVVELRMAVNDPGIFLGMGTKNALGSALAGVFNKLPEIPLNDPNLPNFVAYSKDPDWAGRLVANPQVRNILAELMRDEGPTELRQLSVDKSVLYFRLAYTNINKLTPEGVRRWFGLMLDLVNLVESTK